MTSPVQHMEKILIVDDDPAQAEMVMEFLRLSGFQELDHAANLGELWEWLARDYFDLVLLDYMLPDGNGLQALAEISRRDYQVPVVMVTGQGDERVAAQAIQRGASDYLVKTGDYLVTLPALIHKTVRSYQLELAVQRSLEKVRYQAMLLDNVRDAVVVWDSAGIITYWNRAAAALFGWSEAERLGKPAAVYLEAFQPAVVPPDPSHSSDQHLERQYCTPSGQWIWVSSRVSALMDASGQICTGYMDVAHDITWRKAAQTQLIQAARLATLGELSSGVAHQINNPLTTILVDAQLLVRQLSSDHPAYESAEAIQQAGWRLQNVVQRLMEFSRPAKDTLEPVSVNETLRSALTLVGAQIEAAGIHLEIDLNDPLPQVFGSARQLEDLWINLLLLARDAARPEVSAPRIIISSQAQGEQAVTIAVRDNGMPISAGELPLIFEPSFAGSSGGRGSGMELSICREIVRQHQGEISVESGPEHDTIFRTTLPAVQPKRDLSR